MRGSLYGRPHHDLQMMSLSNDITNKGTWKLNSYVRYVAILKSNGPRRRHQRGTSEQRSKQSTKRKVRYSCMWFLGTPAISILRCPDHPNAESYKDLEEPQRIYRMHENEKKRQYSSRVLDIEHEIFMPLVFTTSGEMSQECLRYHSCLAELIALKKGEQYAGSEQKHHLLY